MADLSELRDRAENLSDSMDGTMNAMAYLVRTQAEMCGEMHALCRLLHEETNDKG
ncbi:MAG: hypothetical protein ROR55_03060 [Devosia sp.]